MKTLLRRDDNIEVLRLESLTGVDRWRTAFAGSYQAIWSEPPYNERFFPDEAEGVLRRAMLNAENINLLAVRDSGVVAGFGLSYPVAANAAIVREIRGILPIEHTFYFADLGVLEPYRRRGLGRQLVDLRLSFIDRSRYHHVLLRVSAVRDAVYEMYRARGFVDTGVYTEVSIRRNDGITRTDRRVYLSKDL